MSILCLNLGEIINCVWFLIDFLTTSKSDRSDRNKYNCHDLNFKCNSYLILPILAKICVLHQMMNTHNSKAEEIHFKINLTEMHIVKN